MVVPDTDLNSNVLTLTLGSTRNINELISLDELSTSQSPRQKIEITLSLKVTSQNSVIPVPETTHDFFLRLTPDCTQSGLNLQPPIQIADLEVTVADNVVCTQILVHKSFYIDASSDMPFCHTIRMQDVKFQLRGQS